jgi:hypothetical protein
MTKKCLFFISHRGKYSGDFQFLRTLNAFLAPNIDFYAKLICSTAKKGAKHDAGQKGENNNCNKVAVTCEYNEDCTL